MYTIGNCDCLNIIDMQLADCQNLQRLNDNTEGIQSEMGPLFVSDWIRPLLNIQVMSEALL